MLALILCSFASCKKKNKDDDKIDVPYAINVEIEYFCDSPDVIEIFNQLGNVVIRASHNGDNMRLDRDMSIDDGKEVVSFTEAYVILDGDVFAEMSYSTPNKASTVKNRSEITLDEAERLYNEITVFGGVKRSHFSDATTESGSKRTVETCKTITEDGKVALEKMLLGELEGSAERVKAKSGEMITVFDGDKYVTREIKCVFDVTFDKNVYSVEVVATLDYDYENVDEIAYPDDIEDYVGVKIDKILGDM